MNKIIQVPMDEKLVKELDDLCKSKRKKRSVLIRQACEQYLKQVEKESLDQACIKSYTEMPEDPQLAEAYAIMASEVLSKEDW